MNALYWVLVALATVSFIWICTKLDFLFKPLGMFVSAVFVPLIIAGFMFYMLNPVVEMLMRIRIKKWRVSRGLAALIVIITLIALVVLGIFSLIPLLTNQIGQLIQNAPHIAAQSQKEISGFIDHSRFMHNTDVQAYVKTLESSFAGWAQGFIKSVTTSLGTVVGTITNVTITAITVPVVLFYMLSDSDKFLPAIKRFFPAKREQQVTDLLKKMGNTISQYISGQVIECLFVGVFTTLGYFLIGMPVGLLLGIIAGLCNIIPYVGPYIGITPAIIVGLILAPSKLLWVIVVVIVVQQIDGNIIYPNIIGKSLKIHPLTIIILLLAAGHLAGIPGMILCIPFYAVLRTVIIYVWNILQLDREKEMHNIKD